MPQEKSCSPNWDGRVAKWKIARIYEEDAGGIHDEDLINDVAYRLFTRCQSMLVVEEARQGRATCPMCESIVEHTAQRNAPLECKICGWVGNWGDYRKSFDGLHLIAPGLQPFCREYVRALPSAQTPKQKMFWIDWLIHRCHWEGTALPGQPGASTLIQGRAQDVNEFLSNLSAGSRDIPGIDDPSRYWSSSQMEQIQKWHKAADRRNQKKKQT